MSSKCIFACLAYDYQIAVGAHWNKQNGHVNRTVGAHWNKQNGHVSNKVSALEGLHGVT